jgi:hypothetical protein
MIEKRDYLKQELADIVYAGRKDIKPESRMKALWREINGCPELVARLRQLRWNPRKWEFKKLEVEAIVHFLCLD